MLPETYRGTYIDPAAWNIQPGMTTTIADQYAEGLGESVMPWPKTNEMGEHAMVQRVKFRYENRTIWAFREPRQLPA